MGFRSTFVTDDLAWKWPQWFREKYASNVHFPLESGPIASVREGKTYGMYTDIPADIQRALSEIEPAEREFRLVLVYLHECGGITRCEIRRDSIRWNEPDGWRVTDGVEHSYCYGCSNAQQPTEE